MEGSGDTRALHDRLVDNGVEIVAPPFPGPVGLTFVFRDLDGYAVAENVADVAREVVDRALK